MQNVIVIKTFQLSHAEIFICCALSVQYNIHWSIASIYNLGIILLPGVLYIGYGPTYCTMRYNYPNTFGHLQLFLVQRCIVYVTVNMCECTTLKQLQMTQNVCTGDSYNLNMLAIYTISSSFPCRQWVASCKQCHTIVVYKISYLGVCVCSFKLCTLTYLA